MNEGDLISITRRQLNQLRDLCSGTEYVIQVKTRYQAHMLEVEDAHFHHDSAVMLPDYGDQAPPEDQAADENKITGIAVLYACYRHSRSNEEQSALVIGHTDRSGSSSYNQALSELRAKNVLYLLQGNRSKWIDVSLQKHKVEDYQQILRWITFSLGWTCDPGAADGVQGPATRQGIHDFQEQYNERFDASITVDGIIGRQTWGAFFDVYMQELRYALGTDEAGLTETRNSLHLMDCESIGCGEEFPVTPDRAENYESQIDRRVEILFFDPGEEPDITCNQPRGACVELYERSMYTMQPISVDPLPVPSGEAVHVILQLVFKDPDPAQPDHNLPEGFPVSVVYLDGSTEVVDLGADGLLDFFAPREKQAFTLEFQFPTEHYIASPAASGGADELIAAAELADRMAQNYRAFMLPSNSSLTTSVWTVTGGTTYSEPRHQFEQLDDMSITNVGSTATPVVVQLDPRWQFLRFEFFDRSFGHGQHNHKRINIPPVLLDGFHRAPADGTATSPDTRSSWVIYEDDLEKTCQCLPWILQSGADVAGGGPMPDNQILIEFRTQSNSYIVSDDPNTRRIEIITDANVLKPGPDRLKYYDLPELWRSIRYHARPASGDGCAFETLTQAQIEESIQPDKPLTFSLDDMVLTDKDLSPISWVPSERLAIFSHKFGPDGHSTLTDYGLYDADGGTANRSYLTKLPSVETSRNYIADYPNWTRLIFARGTLCEVFDQRTMDHDGQVVGARAAVCWADGLVAEPGSRVTDRPDPIIPKTTTGEDYRFFVLQPFFEQNYISRASPLTGGVYDFLDDPNFPSHSSATLYTIGRCDLSLLRCCDIDSGTEVAVSLKFFKFHFDFSTAPPDLKNNVLSAQEKYEDEALENIPKRWNGPDGIYNSGPPVIEKQGTSEVFNTKLLWFAQTTEKNRAHFEIVVESDSGRSSMNSGTGLGKMRESAIKVGDIPGGRRHPGTLVIAHECGHAASLPDEYSEMGTKCSYGYPPIRSNHIPGDFYKLDPSGMMNSNREVRVRYFWHIAEWLRRLYGGSFKIRHRKGTSVYEFEAPKNSGNAQSSTGPLRDFVNWPLTANINARTDSMHARAKVDLYFYALGDDILSASYQRNDIRCQGIVVVLLKLKFSMLPDASNPALTYQLVRRNLNNIDTRLKRLLNNKWRASGSVGSENFENCLVHFSFRYLITTITDEIDPGTGRKNPANTRYLRRNGTTEAGYTRRARGLERTLGIHLVVDVKERGEVNSSSLTGNTLILRENDYDQIEKYVSEFLGFSNGAASTGGIISRIWGFFRAAISTGESVPTESDILPLVQKVLTRSSIDTL